MTSGKKIRMATIMLAGAVTTAGLLPCRAASAQSPAANEAVAPPAGEIRNLALILADPSSTQEQRSEAARRLVAQQQPAARQLLAEALQDFSNLGGQLAVAKALLDDPQPDPSLIVPLFAAVKGPRELSEAAARALGNYKTNPEVLTRLIAQVEQRPPIAERLRRDLIRTIGSIVEKRSAEFLVKVLRAPDETPAIHNAAAEALSELTGITEYGQDAQRWASWWERVAGKPDLEFRNDLFPRRSARFDQLRQRYAELAGSVDAMLRMQYQSAAPAQRPDVLMGYLKHGEPEFRAIGADIMRFEAQDNKAIPAAAKDQLRTMIGDSSAKVRLAVADALARINDATALQPLLAQLAQESDAQVRAAIARALAPINDPAAIPALLAMLDDPSYTAARAAAEAIERLGPKLRQDNPVLAAETAGKLRDALERRPQAPGNSELREALVGAMVPLRQEQLLPSLRTLLEGARGESAEIRRLALRAIGEIGKPQSAGVIVAAIDDRDPRVRREAITALGNIPNAGDYAETLRQRLNPAVEPDADIRDKVWNVLTSTFPNLSVEQLQNFSERFRDEPQRLIFVYKELAAQQLKLRKTDDLATTNQNIGATLMRLNEPKEAALYFKLALDYKKTQNVPDMVVVTLTEDLMKALLLSKQYPEAIAFAAASIRENPIHHQQMGAAIKQEAERLRNAGDLASALALITEAQKMDPPLGSVFRDQLAEIEVDVRNRMKERGIEPGAGARVIQNARTPGPEVTNTADGR